MLMLFGRKELATLVCNIDLATKHYVCMFVILYRELTWLYLIQIVEKYAKILKVRCLTCVFSGSRKTFGIKTSKTDDKTK